MLDRITIKERGPTPRGMKRAYNNHSKAAWQSTGMLFHREMRDKRFTRAHGREAGYQKRQGEEPGLTRAEFFRSYTGRKLRKHSHMRPLEFSGETRRAIRTASISATSKGSRVRYPGARKFNFRRTSAAPKMADEFRKLLPDEIQKLAAHYDETLDDKLNSDNTTSTKQV